MSLVHRKCIFFLMNVVSGLHNTGDEEKSQVLSEFLQNKYKKKCYSYLIIFQTSGKLSSASIFLYESKIKSYMKKK